MARPSKAEDILDASESLLRKRGYAAVSIRDIADKVGVRTAAVHYHFPTKADLVEAVARRYADRFFERLGPPTDGEGGKRMAAAFRIALGMDGRMCLCGVLAAEALGLPEGVAKATEDFMRGVVGWLETAYRGRVDDPRARALALTASLEGAMLLVRAFNDIAIFETALGSLD